ncbi:MAG: hypothetical protein KIT62_06775 [Cyclobacteriaceae bacterium]|nr:hypothetical protein [Cyclobacteriaceae bacterium]
MENKLWLQEEQKFLQAIQDVKIPNAQLEDVALIVPKVIIDLDSIPKGGGCYWIWTNEPVLHSLHKNPTPLPFNGGEIIYNGIAKDDVKGRVKHHLFGEVDAGWSGISLDIHFGDTTSHRKKALSEKGKVPYIKEKKVLQRKTKQHIKGDEVDVFKAIRSKDDFLKIYLTDSEKTIIETVGYEKIYFRNGIDIREDKHKNFEFRVYYITGLSSLYLDFIEKKWREDVGLPKLCSYSSGR